MTKTKTSVSKDKMDMTDEQLELLLRSVETVMAGAGQIPAQQVSVEDVDDYSRLLEMRTTLRAELNKRGLLRKAPCDEHGDRLDRLEARMIEMLKMRDDVPGRVERLEAILREHTENISEIATTMSNTPMAGTGFARNYQATQTRIQELEERIEALETKQG